MKHYLVYWQWGHGGKPAPTLIKADSKADATKRWEARRHGNTTLLKVVKTDPSKWPVCSCQRWYVSDTHSKSCPAYGNTEGTWIVPTRPDGVIR